MKSFKKDSLKKFEIGGSGVRNLCGLALLWKGEGAPGGSG